MTWTVYENAPDVELSMAPTSHVDAIRSILTMLDQMIDEHPPDPGPRRFGNVSFRSWYNAVEACVDELLNEHLGDIVRGGSDASEEAIENGDNSHASAMSEIKAYFLGSWGSAQRLDYGTGHELSFLAFLGGLWKLGAFQLEKDAEGHGTGHGQVERAIVLGIVEP